MCIRDRHQEDRKFIGFVNEIFFGAFAILIFMIIAEVLFFAYNGRLESMVTTAEQKTSTLITEISNYSDISMKLDKVQAKTSSMAILKNNPAPQSQVMALISHSVSESIQLTSVVSDLKSKTVTIKGISNSSDSLSLMQSTLQTDEMVSNVSLVLDPSSTADKYIFTTKVTLSEK